MHHVTRKINRGDGTVGRLINDDRLINDLEGSMSGANEFITGLTRLQTHIDIRSDYLMRRGAFRTSFGLRLQPRPDKYYLFELIDSPMGVHSVTSRNIVTSDATGTSTIDQTETKIEDRLRFSLQIAKKLSFSTWRLGIIENSGGAGVDLELWRRHLSLTAEAFEMDLYEYPRLRSYMQFQFLRVFFVSAGIDDAINAGRRDGFLGVGIRFQDEDLKTIFTATPSVSF
jgi:phospholipid/cholesterol/gamma-HCH transport system substrate-binding protein